MGNTVINAAARFAAVAKTEATTSAVILDAVSRFKTRRHVRDKDFAAFEELCRRVPEPVVVAMVTAVCDDSEVPLQRLPPQWRERAIAAFRASKMKTI